MSEYDFVGQALHQDDGWIIQSLADIDVYKPNMDRYEAEFLRGIQVTFGLINRSRKIPLGLIIDEGEFRRQLDHAKSLLLTSTEVWFLSGMDAFGTRLYPESQIERFKKLSLCDYYLKREGDQYDFRVSGLTDEYVSWWETLAMCIAIELKTRAVTKFMTRNELRVMYARATDKLYRKLRELREHPGIGIVNFGTRRRHSRTWEKFVTEMALEVLGKQFRGVSNVKLAMDLGLNPSGTSAHQIPMEHVTLAYPDQEAMRQAPYAFVRNWEKIFPQTLHIELPDAYTTAAYDREMPEDLARHVMQTWRGRRWDSGDDIEECRQYITRCHRYGVDPMTKLGIFSDGLTHTGIIKRYLEFVDQIAMSFGWGTHFTNDFQGCHPDFDQPFTHIPGVNLTWDEALAGISLVCKLIKVGGTPAVKISNNPNKYTGPPTLKQFYLNTYKVGVQQAQEVPV
jgi:nicotinate phosphoribosyltransferase